MGSPMMPTKPITLFLSMFLFLGLACVTWAVPPTPPPAANFINVWLALGCFDNDRQNSGFERDWLQETTVEPDQGLTSAGKTWHYFDDRLFSRNYDDYQDLFSYFKVKRGESVTAKVAYAHTYVYSVAAQPAQLRIGADNEFKAWMNGTPVASSAHGNPQRDAVKADVKLQAGWNRILVKIANQEEGRLGFYARLCDKDGRSLGGVTYSVQRPGEKLAVRTQSMEDARTGIMPVAWREWPYVGARPNPDTIWDGADEESILSHFIMNRDIMMHASDFVLQAGGGKPPYRWSLCEGDLPPGLSLDRDGAFAGVVAAQAKPCEYKFQVRVKDANGAVAYKNLAIEVRERPNRWFEEGRLVALIHAPERTPKGDCNAMAQLMKAEGYQLGMPISYNNGDAKFRWPSRFVKGGRVTPNDMVAPYKAALEKAGLKFGMYMGNLNNSDPNFTPNQAICVVEEALQRYHPAALWFDWSGLDGESLDSLYSMIRSYDPRILIVLNGHIRGSNGDWDEVCFEGWPAWGPDIWDVWPVPIPWPKKHSPESWRLSVEPECKVSLGIVSDWQEYLRVQISLIGEGFVANMDHSPTIVDQKADTLNALPLMQHHQRMAAWANPPGRPPLYPSYVRVNPGPLASAAWGYNTINLAKDTIYLHILKNARGKTGLPPDRSMTVGPVDGKVKAVTWMNRDQRLPFTQRLTSTDRTITIDLGTVQADPVNTIMKIELASPLPDAPLPAQACIPKGNLASFKHAELLSMDGTRKLGPSARQYARKGVDGLPGTTAAAGGEYAWTYQVDLGRLYRIDKIVVGFREDGYATQYDFLTSDDGLHWETVEHVGKNDRGGAHAATFPAKLAQYVRVQAVKPDGPNQPGGQMSITELEVYECKK
jgi:hypothetical protein